MAARIARWWCLATVAAAREWAVSDRFTGPVEHKPGDVSLGFRIPRNNSETLPNVEPEIDLWVDDHAAFMESVGRNAELCCRLDGMDISKHGGTAYEKQVVS